MLVCQSVPFVSLTSPLPLSLPPSTLVLASVPLSLTVPIELIPKAGSKLAGEEAAGETMETTTAAAATAAQQQEWHKNGQRDGGRERTQKEREIAIETKKHRKIA